MKKLTATICLTIAVLLGSAGMSWSADSNKGLTAYDSGDYATALREWTPLAEQGNVGAQYSLGVMYRDGQGAPKDGKIAVKLLKLAAEQGHSDAQYNLGVMYRDGQGVPRDHRTAVKWLKLAAEQGDANAQLNLGLMYGDGAGVIQDNVYAHMWGNIAASNGQENGRKLRDIVAKRMTAADISAAQKLARECVRKKYKGC